MSTIDDVSYENMKAIIMRVFGAKIKCRASSDDSSVDIKVEPTSANVFSKKAAGDSALYARSNNARGRYNFWPCGNRRGGRMPHGNHSAPRKSNPIGNYDNISRCIIWDSRNTLGMRLSPSIRKTEIYEIIR